MSSVLSYLNSATDMFGGAIDVIIVKQPDGTLRSTPFHVRFGRLKLLRSTEKIIRIMINGKLTDMVMKISSHDGVAYFVQEVPEESHEDSTSSLSSSGTSESSFDDEKWIEMDFDKNHEEAAVSPIEPPAEHDHSLIHETSAPAETAHEKSDAHVSSLSGSNVDDQEPHTRHEEVSPQDATDKISMDTSSRRWKWMNRIFGYQDSQEKDTVEKNDFVEQTLMETLKKKYHYDVDENSESSGEDDSLLFDFEERVPRTRSESHTKPVSAARKSDTPAHSSMPSSLDASSNNSYFYSDDNTDDYADDSLTPSLPPQMRESIRALKRKYASLPRNFGAEKTFLDTPQEPSSPSPTSPKRVSFKEDLEGNESRTSEHSPKTPEKGDDQEKSWWWFSKRNTPQQQKGPPKLRLKRASKPLQKQLQSLDIRKGKNTIKYIVTGRVLGTQEIEASLYLWDYDDKIVISDVDGTITKSDGLGHVLPLLGMDWSHHGIAELYTSIVKNGYKIIYLTSRSIVQSATTKVYISSLRQGKLKLPEGPVILSSDRLFACLTREVILRRPEEFKIAALQEIKSLFHPGDNPQPFFAGFGNRKTDITSYKTVGVPKSKIFTIDPTGNIKVYDNLSHKSYTDVHHLVNLMFPDVKSKFLSTDLSYWNLSIPSVKSIENMSAMSQ